MELTMGIPGPDICITGEGSHGPHVSGGGGYNLDRPFHQSRCDPIPEGGDKAKKKESIKSRVIRVNYLLS